MEIELTRNNDDYCQTKKNGIAFGEIFFRLAGVNASSIEGQL